MCLLYALLAGLRPSNLKFIERLRVSPRSSRGRPEDRGRRGQGKRGCNLPWRNFGSVGPLSSLSSCASFLLFSSSSSSSLSPLRCDGRHPLPSLSRIRSTNETLWPRIFYVSSILDFTIALERQVAGTRERIKNKRDGFLYFLHILRGRKMTSIPLRL